MPNSFGRPDAVRQRGVAIQAWARHRGWQFQFGHRPDVSGLFAGLKLVGDGLLPDLRRRGVDHQHATSMVVFGTTGGLHTVVCELVTTASGQDYHNSVAVVTLPMPVPLLHVEPRRSAGVRRGAPVPERFFATFAVRTSDPAFRTRMLTPGLMGWLVGHSEHQCPPGVRFDTHRLIYWQYQPLVPYWADSVVAHLPRMATGT